MSGVMQYRSVPLDHVGLVDDIDAHAVKVVFPASTTDRHGTQFAPDCFAASLRRNPHPPMLFAHNQADPIGRTVSHQVLPTHLEVINRFSDFDAVPSARRAHTQIADGSLPSFSFGFLGGEQVGHRSLRGVRVYQRATLKETSPVPLGSIPGAQAIDLRWVGTGGPDDELAAALAVLDRRVPVRPQWHKLEPWS